VRQNTSCWGKHHHRQLLCHSQGLPTNAANSELHALTWYVAMSTIHGWERWAIEQQQQWTQQLAAFGPAESHTWNTHCHRNSRDYHFHSDQFPTTQDEPFTGMSTAFNGLDFSSMAATLQEPYINLDNDTTMPAPKALQSDLPLSTQPQLLLMPITLRSYLTSTMMNLLPLKLAPLTSPSWVAMKQMSKLWPELSLNAIIIIV
jgi:hypothetical protein